MPGENYGNNFNQKRGVLNFDTLYFKNVIIGLYNPKIVYRF